jgi:hypothetical protein
MPKVNDVIPAPDSLEELARRINVEHQECGRLLQAGLHHAMNAGKLLLEAKERVGHGGWLPWLKANVPFSERTARGYMRVAREVPKLGEGNRQRVADLSYRKALKALAEPGDEETPDAREGGAPDLVKTLTEMGCPPDASLVPRPGHNLWFVHDWHILWVEPSDTPGLYFVTHVFLGKADDGSDGSVRGTRSPIPPELIPLEVETLGAKGTVALGTAEGKRIESECAPLQYNRWLYHSKEEYFRRGVMGRTD